MLTRAQSDPCSSLVDVRSMDFLHRLDADDFSTHVSPVRSAHASRSFVGAALPIRPLRDPGSARDAVPPERLRGKTKRVIVAHANEIKTRSPNCLDPVIWFVLIVDRDQPSRHRV